MFLQKQVKNIVQLVSQNKNSIVYRYQPKRSPFDKTQYIEDYVPRPNQYPKSRKPKLAEWEDPNIQWPVLLPAPTQLRGKQLIHQIEQREKTIIERNRNFIIPDFRAGDVIQFHFLHSVSEMKGNTFTGICIGRNKRNSLNASFRVIFRFCGVQVEMDIKQNSPFLSDFKLVSKGSGNLRSKLNYLTDLNLTKEELQKPIVKRGVVKRRKDDKLQKKNIQDALPRTHTLDTAVDSILD